jgi:tetratricopeptide (TPR) repeat protein
MKNRDQLLAILGLAHGATQEAIRAQYLKLVKVHTPESDAERFMAISGAYRDLCRRKDEPDTEDDAPEEELKAIQAAYDARSTLDKPLPVESEHIRGLRTLLQSHRRSATLRYHLANLLTESAQGAIEALSLARELVSEWPENLDFRLLEAEALAGCKRSSEAMEALSAILARKPDFIPATIALARLQTRATSYVYAIETIEKGLQANHDDSVALIELLEERFGLELEHKKDTSAATQTATSIRDIGLSQGGRGEIAGYAHVTLENLAIAATDNPQLTRAIMELAERIAPIDPELKELLEDLIRSEEPAGCWETIKNIFWLLAFVTMVVTQCSK